MPDIEIVIRKLAELDVGFYAKHDAPGGQRTVPLDVEEVAAYAADPVAFLARRYGVSKVEYLGWHGSNYCVQCAAKTAKGQQCKAIVTGFSMVESPGVWAKHQGEYCSVHGGRSTSEIDRMERFR